MGTETTIMRSVSSLLVSIVSPILSFVPASITKRLIFWRDLSISFFALAFGRLLPDLNPTPTPVNLSGKTAIVTGSNSGIGLQIATDLARLGCRVYLACRSEDKAKSAISTITWRVPASTGRVRALKLDTSSFDSVKTFVETWSGQPDKQIDILVHNAGIAAPAPSASDLTDEGIDVIYATNVLGSFVLTHFLEPYLSATARVVFTSSTGQYGAAFSPDFSPGPVRGVVEPGFHCPLKRIPWLFGAEFPSSGASGRYSNTKAMQCAFAKLLQRRFDRELLTETTTTERKDDSLRDSEVFANGIGIVSPSAMTAATMKKTRGRTAHAFTPGFTDTPIFGKFESKGILADAVFSLLRATTALAIDVDQGAATGTWLASTEDEEVVGFGKGGGYWDRMTRRVSKADAMSEQLLERLWLRWERDSGVEWR